MRDAEFYNRIADKLLSTEPILRKYREVLEKGRLLDVEFVKAAWPDYEVDVEKMHDVTRYMLSVESTLTPEEISKVYAVVRSALGYGP